MKMMANDAGFRYSELLRLTLEPAQGRVCWRPPAMVAAARRAVGRR